MLSNPFLLIVNVNATGFQRESRRVHHRIFPGSIPLRLRGCLVAAMLEVARSRRPPLPEIVLWIAASRSPSESQTSECSDLLSRSRATFVIVAQRQPGKLPSKHRSRAELDSEASPSGISNTRSAQISNTCNYRTNKRWAGSFGCESPRSDCCSAGGCCAPL